MPDVNEDRFWFDRGYSLGVTETQRDAVIPRLLGAWTLFGMMLWDAWLTLPFLVLYTLWTLSDWRDRKAEAERKREIRDPGELWE